MRYVLFFFILVIVFSCGRSREVQSESKKQSNMFDVERDLFFRSLHEPEDVKSMLSSVLTNFDRSALHDPKLKVNYMGNDIKAAANLGVYISDLNYCILSNKKEEARAYFNAAYELSEVIQVEKSMLDFLMERYESNLEKNDSLNAVVVQLFDQATLKLRDTDHERLAGITMAGYQIENLYLVLATLKSLPESLTDEQRVSKEQLIRYVLKQKNQIEVIYNFIRGHADPLDPNRNPNYPFFDNALRELIAVYRQTNENTPLTELTAKVDAIRNKIVSVE